MQHVPRRGGHRALLVRSSDRVHRLRVPDERRRARGGRSLVSCDEPTLRSLSSVRPRPAALLPHRPGRLVLHPAPARALRHPLEQRGVPRSARACRHSDTARWQEEARAQGQGAQAAAEERAAALEKSHSRDELRIWRRGVVSALISVPAAPALGLCDIAHVAAKGAPVRFAAAAALIMPSTRRAQLATISALSANGRRRCSMRGHHRGARGQGR